MNVMKHVLPLDEKRSSIAREKHSAISELSTPQIGVKSLPDLAHVLIKLGQMHRAAPRHITVMVWKTVGLIDFEHDFRLICCALVVVVFELLSFLML